MVVGSLSQETEIVVIGAGPGGYVAALRAADLGREVMLVEELERFGGTCLLEGCIPSKALIHGVAVLETMKSSNDLGFRSRGVDVDVATLRSWMNTVVSDLSAGVGRLLKNRNVEVIKGRARLTGPNTLAIEGSGSSTVQFKHCIIATGSVINEVPASFKVPVWSSAEALRLPSVPERLLVVGGGYIGLEMGLVYSGLGSRVTVVEFFPRFLPGADPDLVQVVVKSCKDKFEAILVESKVAALEKTSVGFAATIDHQGVTSKIEFDQVLVATGRRPNTRGLGLENIGVKMLGNGMIEVDSECRTNVPGIFAIGDIVPGPMLAHKASREAKVAAEVVSGLKAAVDNRAIPAVVFTDPQIAWTGITETEAEKEKLETKIGRFPLSALGKARAMGRTDGVVKVIADSQSHLLLGVGVVAANAAELIAEATLAIEMGATLEDIVDTIHPHPTMSEALLEAAEVALGQGIHVSGGRKR